MSGQTPQLNHGQMQRCRSCGASIVWCYTLAGKKAPYQPDPKGEFVIENGTARHVGPPAAQLELGASAQSPQQRYVSHFSTCPDAPKWRGEK